MHITNIGIKAYNLKLKKCFGIAHLDIYKLIGVLQELEIEAKQKYIHKYKNSLPAPHWRKLDFKHSTDSTLLKGMLKDKEITIDIYIKKVLNIYFDFGALKKKEKKLNKQVLENLIVTLTIH